MPEGSAVAAARWQSHRTDAQVVPALPVAIPATKADAPEDLLQTACGAQTTGATFQGGRVIFKHECTARHAHVGDEARAASRHC